MGRLNVKDDLLILIPAYNEAAFITGVVAAVRPLAARVLVVDDGSGDRTAELAAAAGAEVVRHPVNRGKGRALQTGFRYALDKGYRVVLVMDGDGQHHPEDIPGLLERFQRGGVGVVVGCRPRNLANMPLDRFLTNWFTSALVSLLAGQCIRDSQCGFRVFDSRVFPALSFSTGRFDTESEVLVEASRAGFRIASAPVRTIYGQEKSKINPLVDTLRFFRFCLRMLGRICLGRACPR